MEDTIKTHWRKPSYSGNGGGNCVEVANAARIVAIRDSKYPDGPRLAVSPAGWRAFIGRVQQDR
jgi:Domain of unknown function (DUF397)